MSQFTTEILRDSNGNKYIIVVTLCTSCRGTGVYAGYAERSGVANVCWTCNGEGNHGMKVYLPTERLIERDDVKFVRKNADSTEKIPYESFLKGKRPK